MGKYANEAMGKNTLTSPYNTGTASYINCYFTKNSKQICTFAYSAHLHIFQLFNQLIPHTVHDKPADGFGTHFGLHVLPDGFDSAGA